jgi:hypothetical protein
MGKTFVTEDSMMLLYRAGILTFTGALSSAHVLEVCLSQLFNRNLLCLPYEFLKLKRKERD